MACPVNKLVYLLAFIIGLTGIGSALRIVTEPRTYNDSTKKLNISCVIDGPTTVTNSVISIEIVKESEDKTIALIDNNGMKMGSGMKDNMKVDGHVHNDGSKSYLTLTINNPGRRDAGMYRCQLFFLDDQSQVSQKDANGSVTYQDKLKDLIVNVSAILTTVQEQGDFDYMMNEKMKRLEKLITDNNRKWVEKFDKQREQIEELKNDDTKKQERLDIMMDLIQRQNETIHGLGIQLRNLNKQVNACCTSVPVTTSSATTTTTPSTTTTLTSTITTTATTNSTSTTTGCRDESWTHYKQDGTCLRLFLNNHLSWSNAREVCLTFGGDLVVIRDEDKNTFVYNLVSKSGFGVWIGVKNNGHDFTYVDGSNLGTYQPWYQEPINDRYQDQRCVVMYTGSDFPGEWTDMLCNWTRPYLCSVPSHGVSPTSS